MIKVSQKCKTLEEGIKFMMVGAKADYVRMSTNNGLKELTGYSLEQTSNWDKMIKITNGKKYIKVVRENGVFAFIVKEDFKHFKKGDILKPAGFNAPALNSARGNVLSGNYPIQWTGPLYLK
tara:strand:+ start:1461 stop:1826 length:366 start_codon:yes stop_codon:yes gene_type:complete